MSVRCYATPGKPKALRICAAFAEGCDGEVVETIPAKLLPGPAMFYGVTPATAHLYEQAKLEERDVYYLDNSYLDATREIYFRATKNRLQHSGVGPSDGTRFAALNIPLSPWTHEVRGHVLFCPQSDEFMRVVVGYRGNWLAETLAAARTVSPLPFVSRPWIRNKRESYRTLPAALQKCWAVVTWSSASAITAILRGVPAICLGADCIARPVSGRTLADLADPPRPIDRMSWLNAVADNQWSIPELRSGLCWRMLNDQLAKAA